jgi:hypothetical protein
MGCKKFQKWIYLYRPEELSPRQAGVLEKHLRECPVCAGVREQAARLERLTSEARTRCGEPVPANPEKTAKRVLAAVESARSSGDSRTVKAGPGARKRLGIIIGEFLRPAVIRPVFAAIAIFIIGVFFIQETMILRRVSRLEQRIATAAGTETPFLENMLEKRFIRPAGILERSTGLSEDEWVTIRRSELESLVEECKRSRELNAELTKILGGNAVFERKDVLTSRINVAEAERYLARHPELSDRIFSWLNHGGKI